MKNRLPICALACLFLAATAFGASPELLPPPRVVENHVRLEQIKGGYEIYLSRKASETFRDALKQVGDGTPYTDFAKLASKDLNDPQAEKIILIAALIVKTQAPALKKALDDKMDVGGAVIKVWGIEHKVIPEPPPALKALGEAFLPEKVKGQVQAGIKMVNTTPLCWRVEGRK